MYARGKRLVIAGTASVALLAVGRTLSFGFEPPEHEQFLPGEPVQPQEAKEGPADVKDDDSRSEGGQGIGTGLFRGRYELSINGSKVLVGGARATVRPSVLTAVANVQLAFIDVLLLSPEASGASRQSFAPDSARSVDGRGGGGAARLVLQGLELAGAHRFLASGYWQMKDPKGDLHCPMEAVLSLDTAGKGKPRVSEGSGPLESLPSTAEEDLAAAWGPAASLGFVAQATSSQCGLKLQIQVQPVDLDRIAKKVHRYTAWANLLTLLQIGCFVSQTRHTADTISASKMSLFALGLQALMDAYDAVLHLSLRFSVNYMWHTFATIPLIKFMFVFLQVQNLLHTLRFRFDVLRDSWEALRTELVRTYMCFYFALIAGIYLIFSFLAYLPAYVILLQLYWAPQIAFDLRRGTKCSFRLPVIVISSAARSLAVLYLWGCPDSLFDGDVYPKLPSAPSASLCVAVLTLQVAQVAIMFSQRAYGPRWFVPWACMPKVYNYSRRVERLPEECVICMLDFGSSQENLSAITPCNHCFHRACLERWMDLKMECPSCRAPLPIIV